MGMKQVGRSAIVEGAGARLPAIILFRTSCFLLLADCTSAAAARPDAVGGGSDANSFQGFKWQDACTTMLGGSAAITVSDGSATTDVCIPASACAMRGTYVGEFYLQMGIIGVRGQGEPCQVNLYLPLGSSGDISTHRYAFGPSLAKSSDEVIAFSYYYSGYNEWGDQDLTAFPAPNVSAWTGTSTIESLPRVGGMIMGTFIYDGTDLEGRQRKVNATFSVPRYPDYDWVVLPDGGVP